jgi:methionine-rich copper-binding protein CopC
MLKHSPAYAIAWFNAELDARSSTLEVVDVNGRQVDYGDGGVELNNPDLATMVVSLPTLPEGVYIARWSAVTARDGDLVGGVFTFGVADSGIAPDQISTAQTSLADTEAQTSSTDGRDSRPLDLVLTGLGVLLTVMIGVIPYARLARAS